MLVHRITILLICAMVLSGCSGINPSEIAINSDKPVESLAIKDSSMSTLKLDLDSIDKWYLIGTNRFFDFNQIRHLSERRDGIDFNVSDFGHDTEDRFISYFKIYIDSIGNVFEYDNDSDSLTPYFENESRRCNVKTLLWVDSLRQLRKLNEKDLYLLFRSVNPYCQNNVEYSEMVNEYLWKSLMNNPQKFTFALCNESVSKEQKEFIVSEISSPLVDTFQPNDLIDSILSRNLIYRDSVAVKNLVDALKVAQSNYE